MKKYSPNFERDYNFYLSNLENFTFCGTLNPKHIAVYDSNGVDAKKAFHSIESNGKNPATKEKELLDNLLLCKASVNFQIKQWAEGLADETLTYSELVGGTETLNWHIDSEGNPIPTYFASIKDKYKLPDWVLTAVVNQAKKLIKQKTL